MAEQSLPEKAGENEANREKVRVIPLKYIDDSPDHPFQVRDDEEMMSLVESIATFGVITPVIARKKDDERYELISGHRRKHACELLHIDTLPIIVRDNGENGRMSKACGYVLRDSGGAYGTLKYAVKRALNTINLAEIQKNV